MWCLSINVPFPFPLRFAVTPPPPKFTALSHVYARDLFPSPLCRISLQCLLIPFVIPPPNSRFSRISACVFFDMFIGSFLPSRPNSPLSPIPIPFYQAWRQLTLPPQDGFPE